MEPIILPRVSDQKPLVSVVSITYNHEPYIKACLDGFLLQKTDFPVEYIVHDDASTDHTADIIREYYEKRPDLFHVIIQQENQHSQHIPSWPKLFKIAQGNYIALCEGDDYWTDPLKLQKQFDFMENNPDYSLCATKSIIYEEKSGKKYPVKISKKGAVFFEELLFGSNPFVTCTLFIKKRIALEWFDLSSRINKKRWIMGDLPLILFCLHAKKGYIIDHSTSCYRVLEESASHGDIYKLIRLQKGSTHIRLAFNSIFKKKYPSSIFIQKCAYGLIVIEIQKYKTIQKKRIRYYWKLYWKKKSRLHYKIMQFLALYVLALLISHLKLFIDRLNTR